jgi:hypothetical protein
MYQKAITTLTVCFYYLYFLAICESFVWLDKSGIIILAFTGVHMIVKFYQFVDYGSTKDSNLYPYRNLSIGFRNALILCDTLITFIVLFGFLFIENREDETEDLFRTLLCTFCFPISIVNIIKHHKRQVEAASISSRFSQNFGNI